MFTIYNFGLIDIAAIEQFSSFNAKQPQIKANTSCEDNDEMML